MENEKIGGCMEGWVAALPSLLPAVLQTPTKWLSSPGLQTLASTPLILWHVVHFGHMTAPALSVMYLMSLLNGSRGTMHSPWACLSPVATLPGTCCVVLVMPAPFLLWALAFSLKYGHWMIYLLSSHTHCHSQFYPKYYTNERKTDIEGDRRDRGDVGGRKNRRKEGREGSQNWISR